MMDVYLDIETSYRNEITVFGVYRENIGVHQLIGRDITRKGIFDILKGADVIYTYNGSRFDLPVIARRTGVNLSNHFEPHDLMYDCWKRNLYGGLKKVERVLGIKRDLYDIDGREAMALWEQFVWFKDKEALQKLLKYNKEDVVNLSLLRESLEKYR